MINEHILLASQSPQRAQLLRQLDCPFTVDAVPCQETVDPALPPHEVVQSIALQKAEAYLAARAGAFPDTAGDDPLLLTADTVVVQDGHIMGKPRSREEAEGFLLRLSQQTHTVYTGVHLRSLSSGTTATFYDAAEVEFVELTRALLQHYLDTCEWQEAAGGYRIQGIGGALVARIHGAYPTVVGLPIHRIYGIVCAIARG